MEKIKAVLKALEEKRQEINRFRKEKHIGTLRGLEEIIAKIKQAQTEQQENDGRNN